MNFYSLKYIVLLGFIPVVVALFYLGYRSRKLLLSNFVSPSLWKKVIPSRRPTRRFWKKALLVFSLLFLIIAIMRPQYGLKHEQVQRKGQDVFVVLDTSHSMGAQDIPSSRFEHAKLEIVNLVDQLQGDRVGLVVFSGEAMVQVPLTVDYDAFKMFLNDTYLGMLPRPGTNLAEAIKRARVSFDVSNSKTRSMIIISDGEIFEGDAMASARVAKQQGIQIYTIAIGGDAGEPVPERDRRGTVSGYKKDSDGQIVLSKVDYAQLRQIALLTGGEFFSVTNASLVMDRLYKILSLQEKDLLEEQLLQRYKDQYQWVLLIAFLLLLGEFIFSERGKEQ